MLLQAGADTQIKENVRNFQSLLGVFTLGNLIYVNENTTLYAGPHGARSSEGRQYCANL